MATTNLISRSLGDVLIESGNGTPNHTSPKGSVYTDQDTGLQYANLDGSTTWAELILAAFGDAYRNATSTVSPSTTGWTELTTNITLRDSLGVTLTSGRLVIDSNFGGTYGVLLSGTVQYVATATSYTFGVSKNQAAPTAGATQATSVSATRTTGTASVFTSLSLVATDTVSVVLQAGATGNVNVLYQSLLIWRKD